MTKPTNLAAVAAPVLPIEPEGVDANHPQLPGLARTSPPVAIALPVPNAPKVTVRALARAMRVAEFWSLALFPEAEAPAVERQAPARRQRRTYAEKWEQRWLLPELAPKRHLALAMPTPGFTCLSEAKGCVHEHCRHNLGATHTFRGAQFTCSIDVANAFPHGLPPVFVARLAGLPEGYVQSAEKTVARRHGPAMAKLWSERYDHLPKKRSKAVKRIWF